jgi:[protein-PII] uridylyltransferase
VSQLVARTAHVLEGGRSSEVTADTDALPDDVEAMAARRQHGVVVDGVEVTVVTEDRPGVFARAAGALALAGLDVLAASATSRGSTAISWFRVESTLGGEVDGDRVRRDVERAVVGRLSIDARLADRARTYRQSRSRAAAPPEARVIVDNEASETATVLEVRTADALGVLYFVTKALADLDLDIRSAKVQTLGHEVVDTFYVTDAGGKKITDAEHLAEIEAADRWPTSPRGPIRRSPPTTSCGGVRLWPRSPRPDWASATTSTSASGSRRCSEWPPRSGWPPVTSWPPRCSSTSG